MPISRHPLCFIPFVLLLVWSQAASAQSCFRGRPSPECRTFWLVESGLGVGLHQGTPDAYATLEVGMMRNLNERSALGWTLLGGGDGRAVRTGVKVRYRRWLNDWIGLDVSPGVLFGGGAQIAPGFTGHLGLSLGDYFSVTTQLEIYDDETTMPKATVGYLGFKLGSMPGIIGTVVGGAGLLAVIVAIAGAG